MTIYLIAGERELGEEYLCELVRPKAICHGPRTSPIVRVLRILRYPRQHAIIWPDVPNDVSPLEGGKIYLLPSIRAATDEEIERFADWETSLSVTQAEALVEAPPAEQVILIRHRMGVYTSRRVLHTIDE